MDLCTAQRQLHHHYHHQQQEMDSQNQDKNPNANSPAPNQKPRPADDEPQKCPRCDSTNTKFCYYNNYSLSQPRYFCKGCRRYWTKGGTLRNVPVGGGCRKTSKRPSSPNSNFILKRAHTQDAPAPAPPLFYGYANLTDCDGQLPNPQAFGFLDSLRYGNGGVFEGVCYGGWDGVSGALDDVAGAVGMNAVVVKQENEGRVADVEPVRGLFGNSAWQGLLF